MERIVLEHRHRRRQRRTSGLATATPGELPSVHSCCRAGKTDEAGEALSAVDRTTRNRKVLWRASLPPRDPSQGEQQTMSVAIITGSCGLIGSQATRHFAGLGLHVVGVDNDMRQVFFGPEGSTAWMRARLEEDLGERYTHTSIDI